ncbi:hypothetical protein L486_03065 [Kwoniella mangroviensis CBS 10435]|uniref:BHLH domain-containing protein n=1 Tax=Kwoniella mangroviensis CBS 10435 TaxID=1331196 RepID=A0A1B9ISQ9_9TREE|nr:hypothetical protein L486_03065 [Kwoniella mangroviensis CBS 10435]
MASIKGSVLMLPIRIPGVDNNNNRPSMHRPFSDGSMTVETNLLTSLMSGSPHQIPMNMVSPFSFSSSLPAQTHTFDYSMNSPLSSSADRFHPAAMFSAMKFGNDNPEPPINFGNNEDQTANDERSRSQSSSRSSHVGKAPSSRSRSARKSMNDARPPPGSIQPRGRSALPGRAQSFSGPGSAQARATSQNGSGKPMGLGIGLDTHVEGEQTDSISPPDFGLNGSFGMSIPRTEIDTVSWGSGSVPSMLQPGSLGSFGETLDDAIIDSPMTPAKPLQALSDESYKKQRRRECHNQVEKRRREHINAKIEELSHLLPAMYNLPDNDEVLLDDEEEEGKPQIESGKKKKKTKRAGSMNTKSQKDAVQCKGRILSHSVQYIRDLKHVTDVQAGRIAHLEAMLMSYGVNPAIQPPAMSDAQSSLFWMGDGNSNSNTLNNQPNFDLSGTHNLEVMRPSPEPDRPFSFDHINLDARTWANTMTNGNGHDTAHDVLMSFEPSPNTASTSSVNNLRRSSESVSSSASFDRENTEALDMHSPLSMNMSISDMRGRQRERTVRKDSQAELQMSMSALLSGAGGREGNDGGMRW